MLKVVLLAYSQMFAIDGVRLASNASKERSGIVEVHAKIQPQQVELQAIFARHGHACQAP